MVKGSATGPTVGAGDAYDTSFVAASALVSVWYSVCASATVWSAHTAAGDRWHVTGDRQGCRRPGRWCISTHAQGRTDRIYYLFSLIGEERTQQCREYNSARMRSPLRSPAWRLRVPRCTCRLREVPCKTARYVSREQPSSTHGVHQHINGMPQEKTPLRQPRGWRDATSRCEIIEGINALDVGSTADLQRGEVDCRQPARHEHRVGRPDVGPACRPASQITARPQHSIVRANQRVAHTEKIP